MIVKVEITNFDKVIRLRLPDGASTADVKAAIEAMEAQLWVQFATPSPGDTVRGWFRASQVEPYQPDDEEDAHYICTLTPDAPSERRPVNGIVYGTADDIPTTIANNPEPIDLTPGKAGVVHPSLLKRSMRQGPATPGTFVDYTNMTGRRS